ncbi:MAG: ATP-binding cassette domain-containing protein, partial [Candidatus Thorarchaeota archaeon]
MTISLNLINIGHNYYSKKGIITAIKYPLNLTIENPLTFILGPNGSGKTTLLSLISGQLFPTNGSVQLSIGGRNIDGLKKNKLLKQHIVFSFQEALFDRRYTIIKCLRMHGLIFGLSYSEINSLIKELLQEFGLWEKRNMYISQVSGGQRKQLEIIRSLLIALTRKKKNEFVFITDEPTAFCDINAKKRIWNHLSSLKDAGMNLLVSTNDLKEAERYESIIVFLRKGT